MTSALVKYYTQQAGGGGPSPMGPLYRQHVVYQKGSVSGLCVWKNNKIFKPHSNEWFGGDR